MTHHYEEQRVPNKQFSLILRERKIKFQKDQIMLDKLFKKSKKLEASIINPEKINQQNTKSKRPSNRHEIEQSLLQSNEEIYKQSIESPKLNDVKRQYYLRQKAQNFIQRLKKQKEYNQGKFLLLRKKEEKRKQQEKLKINAARRQIAQSFHRQKVDQAMINIMIHQERIIFRADESAMRSMKKSNIRSKTQNTDRYESGRQSLPISPDSLPKVPSICKTSKKAILSS